MKRHTLSSVTEWLVYPGIIGGSFVLYAALNHTFVPHVALAISLAFGGIFIILGEVLFPYRAAWQPSRAEVWLDSLFVAIVQVLFTLALAAALALLLQIQQQVGPATPFARVWPHHWPVVSQVILMVVATDLLRYVVHVAAHHVPWLWRFHSLHHAAERLYALNAARFHPVEKALQFLFDTAPFVLLGVGPGATTAFFLFYALNALLQHANIRMRFGVLNYIISTADLHRWHHARETARRPRNYGNNTILWDIVFGTWYLPSTELSAVGVDDRPSPETFWTSMTEPFTPAWTSPRAPAKPEIVDAV